MYRCETSSGAAFFNVPGGGGGGGERTASATPSGFPRVNSSTQRGRDDVRRKVLNEELATEEKLLAEAKAAVGSGALAPFPDELNNQQKYNDRVAKLRQTVNLHEKNVEALRKELAAVK